MTSSLSNSNYTVTSPTTYSDVLERWALSSAAAAQSYSVARCWQDFTATFFKNHGHLRTFHRQNFTLTACFLTLYGYFKLNLLANNIMQSYAHGPTYSRLEYHVPIVYFSYATQYAYNLHDTSTGFIRGILRGVRYAKSLRVLFLHRRSPSWTTLVLYSRVVFIFNEPTKGFGRKSGCVYTSYTSAFHFHLHP